MHEFKVFTRKELSAAFLAMVGNYEAAEITFAPEGGGKCIYTLPDITERSRQEHDMRDARLRKYAKHAARRL